VAAWSIIGVLVLLAIGAWFLWKIRVIFPPLVLALLLIYLLNPLVTRFAQRRIPRPVGAVTSFVILFGALAIIIAVAAPFVSSQAEDFSRGWPRFQVDLANSIEDLAESTESRLGIDIDAARATCLLGSDEDVDDPSAPSHERCDEVTQDFRDFVLERADRATEVASSLIEVVVIFVLAPLLALYLLIDLPDLQRDVLNLFPEHMRNEMSDLGGKIGRAVGGFFRGQLLVALVVGVLSSFGFWIVGLDFWLPIGAAAGFTNLIPLVGPFIGGGLGFVVGTVTEGAGVGIKAVIVAIVVQQIDNHLISPKVMQRTVQLHPATVMLSLLAGGTLAGFWGVLLAVPGVAVVKLLLAHLWTTRVLGSPASPYAPGVAPGTPERPPPDDG
jgi:predicted PurR-regulated permease PerM